MRLSENREHLPIWGDAIPGNTGKSKYDVMHVDKTMSPMDALMKYPGIWDKSTDELGDLQGNDYMVWDEEIRDGYAEETFSDVPVLIPYLVEGSDRCVILCPGGAYLTKSVDSEGEEVAAFLCACMDDMVVAPERLIELAAAYKEKGVPCEVHLFPYGGHGFGACQEHPVPDYIPVPPADYTACRQWKTLFVHWLRHVFD